MSDIRKIKEKLDALLKRARDNGSSEAEVAACMARAEKIMAEYGLSESDLDDVTSESFRDYRVEVPQGRQKHCPVVRYCAAMVGKLTCVTFYVDNANSPNAGDKADIVAVGLDADVEYAMWLLSSLRTFMDDQWVSYRDWQLEACTRQELKAERIGFIRGYCRKVCDRVREMVDVYEREHAGGVGTGTNLIVRKTDLVNAELDRRGIHLGRGRAMTGRGYGSEHGAQAGAQAGNSASLGRGVGQGRAAIGAS